jgi:hypothetical protein
MSKFRDRELVFIPFLSWFFLHDSSRVISPLLTLSLPRRVEIVMLNRYLKTVVYSIMVLQSRLSLAHLQSGHGLEERMPHSSISTVQRLLLALPFLVAILLKTRFLGHALN